MNATRAFTLLLILNLPVTLPMRISLMQPMRSVLNFAGMIAKASSRSPFDYMNYGNWCGLGGEGEPRDDADRCCQAHDKCYGNYTKTRGCGGLFDNLSVYVRSYDWDYDEHEKKIICNVENSKCGQYLCLCDKVCVECLSSTNYNPQFKHG